MNPKKLLDKSIPLLNILDSLDAIIYVADMETYELLYINEYSKNIFGDVVGKICWQSLQTSQTGPCPFCSNSKLLDSKGKPTGTYVWEFQNTVNNAWYEVRDKAIERVDGRLVRLEIATDITERKRAEAVLLENEERFRKIFEEGPLGMALFDLEKNKFVQVNARLCNLLGYKQEELLRVTFPAISHKDDREKAVQLSKLLVAGEIPYYSLEKRYLKKNKEILWAHLTASIIRDEYGKSLYGLAMIQDISERKKSEKNILKQNQFLESVIESLPYPFLVIDAQSYEIILANAQVAPENKWKGLTCHQVTHHNDFPCEDKEHLCPLEKVKKDKLPTVVEHSHFNKEGQEKNFEVHGAPILDDNGNVIQMIEYSVDITDRKLLEKKLEEISMTDDLTGALNRRGFMTIADQQVKVAKRAKQGVCLLYADLDNMKEINDRFGHTVGDKALVETAEILNSTFREADVIGRLGGDEFAVLITGENDCGAYKTLIKRLSENLLAVNQHPDRLYRLEMSTGVASLEIDTQSSIDELLAQADMLMYENKKRKKESK